MKDKQKDLSRNIWKDVKALVSEHSLKLGPYFAYQLSETPKHLLFTFARYKFAASMLPLSKETEVLELGCNEGIGTLILTDKAKRIVAVDFDENAVAFAKETLSGREITFLHADFLDKQFGAFDAVISLDVIEHINKKDETLYFKTVMDNLRDQGICIIGTPNVTASQYASEHSKKGHVNMYSAEMLYAKMSQYFHNVFLFGMNDEILHTGFYPMCHYLLAIGCNRKV